jgi:hypothetical protein
MRRVGILLSSLLLTYLSSAQNVHIPGPGRDGVVKAENGLMIGWQLISEDRATTQISLYDGDGKLLVGLAPLRSVPEAKRVAIHDVSALPGHMIAVAAVYSKGEDSVPTASLLCFDFRGGLLWALALEPSREAWRLTVDAESNIWTLPAGAGEQKPSDAPMLVGYRPTGKVFKEMFRRSEFGIHALETQENETVGSPGIGHTLGGIWLWLPGSTDLVRFKPDGSSVIRSTTSLPQQSQQETPLKVLFTDNGVLLAQIYDPEEMKRSGQQPLFLMSPGTKHWQPLDTPCTSCRMIGVDGERVLFGKQSADEVEIYASTLPLAD